MNSQIPVVAEISPSEAFWQAVRLEIARRPWPLVGFAVAAFSLIVLFVLGVLAGPWPGLINASWDVDVLGQGMTGGLAGFLSTALGASLALGFRRISAQTEDVMLGFAAGMMLAASAFALILPGIDAAKTAMEAAYVTAEAVNPIANFSVMAVGIVILGMAGGVFLMLGLDRLTPHAHTQSGPCGPACQRIGRVWLFVLAITLHNLPEGMAIGVGFGQGDTSVGLPLASAISIQNIPEGLAVAMALRSTGLRTGMAVVIASATGLMEPFGALIGLVLSGGMVMAYPIGLGMAAGAMIFVVSHEVIPETHRNGHQTMATVGLMAGFMAMMFLDVALG